MIKQMLNDAFSANPLMGEVISLQRELTKVQNENAIMRRKIYRLEMALKQEVSELFLDDKRTYWVGGDDDKS